MFSAAVIAMADLRSGIIITGSSSTTGASMDRPTIIRGGAAASSGPITARGAFAIGATIGVITTVGITAGIGESAA
jgi:hypothetical protein